MTDEQRDLDNLLKHPGWLRVVEHGLTDIDGMIQSAMHNAAGERDDVMALNLLRQCLAAKKAVTAFITWPDARLKALIHAPTATSTPQLSRRGSL